MKVLFDASIPAPLLHYLRSHTVTQAHELGWHRSQDGALLTAAAEAGFEVVITCGQSLHDQPNFRRNIAVLTLSTCHWPTIRQAARKIASAVDVVQPGSVTRFEV